MSDMEKNINLTPVREQAVKVMVVAHQIGILDPMQNGMDATGAIESIVAYANNFTGEAFGTVLGYKNVELVFTIQMTDVSTDGNATYMTPVITRIKVSHYPYPLKGVNYSGIERSCNEAIQKYVVKNNV